MVISAAAFLLVVFKLVLVVAWAGGSAIWLLWPINDQPTSRWQFVLWGGGIALLAVVLFTNLITFTA